MKLRGAVRSWGGKISINHPQNRWVLIIMPQLRSNSLSDSQTMQADNSKIMTGIQEILGRLQSIKSRMRTMEECVAGFDKRIKDV